MLNENRAKGLLKYVDSDSINVADIGLGSLGAPSVSPDALGHIFTRHRVVYFQRLVMIKYNIPNFRNVLAGGERALAILPKLTPCYALMPLQPIASFRTF